MKERFFYLFVIVGLGFLLFLNKCGDNYHIPTPTIRIDTTIVVDTVYPPPVIVQLPQQPPPAPVVFYVDSSGASTTPEQAATVAKLYQDSIEDDNLTLFYKSTVEGTLLNQDMSYRLKIPKEINKTVTITTSHPVPAPQLFLKSNVGLDRLGNASLSIGLEYTSRHRWAIGYNYDLLQKRHEITLGYALWRGK